MGRLSTCRPPHLPASIQYATFYATVSKRTLTAALKLRPDDAATLRNRGVAYLELRDFQHAIDDLQSALRLTGNTPEAKLALATAYELRSHDHFQEGRYRESADDMTSAIELSPEPAVQYRRRASCFFHLEEYEKAIEDLDVAISKEPQNPEHYQYRGMTYERLGNDQAAKADFQKMQELGGK